MKTMTQKITCDATPHQVFELYMDEKKHAAFTGSPASIGRNAGSSFKVWDGYATGKTLELEPDRKIVQQWRASDWPAGHYSTITILLEPASPSKTQLTFSQHGIPDNQYAEIKQGWTDFYWKPMKAYLKAQGKSSQAR